MSSNLSATRLAGKASRAGGIGVDAAVAAAERRLDNMRDRIMEEVDRQLAIIRASAPGLARADASASPAIVSAADMLTGLCGAADLRPIGNVACRICKLSDEVGPTLPFEAVKLLSDTMTLLRELGDGGRQAAWIELRPGLDKALIASTARLLRKP